MKTRILDAVLLLSLVGCGASGTNGLSSGNASAGASSNLGAATNNRLLPPPPPGQPGTVKLQVEVSPKAELSPRSGPLVVDFNAGWNLFAMPFPNPTAFSLDQPGNVLGCARYDAGSGSYVDQSFSQNAFASSNPFTGYWVYCSGPTRLSLDGTDQAQVQLSTNLVPGWNLVGTPLSADVPVSELRFQAGTLSNAFSTFLLWPGVLTYQGGSYVELGHPPTTFTAGRSQWIYAYQAGSLSRPAQVLVSNGSFEQPVVTPGGFQLWGLGSTSIPGWTVVGSAGNVATLGANFAENGFTFAAQDGNQSLDLTGNTDSSTGVAQTVSTVPGSTYQISFYIGNVVDSRSISVYGVTSTTRVLLDGSQIFSATNSNGSTSINWQQFTTTFTATSTSHVVSFINADPVNDSANCLDNVVISELPPASAKRSDDLPRP